MRLGNHSKLTTLVGTFALVAWMPIAAAEDFEGDAYALSTCLTSNETLGSTSEIWQLVYEGRDLRFCCEGCVEMFKTKSNAARYFLRLDARMKKQQMPYYPLDTCVVSGEKLGANSKDIIVGNRLVRLSSESCQSAFDAEPSKYLAKLDEAVIAKQSANYPFTKCVISDKELGDTFINYIVGNRLFKLAGDEYIGLFEENPSYYVRMLEQTEVEVARGAKLIRWLGCTECHTVHGKGAGVRAGVKAPEWADTLGTIVKMQSGEEVEITRDYLVKSITEPNSQIVSGYSAGKMPGRFAYLPEKDVTAIVTYIETLTKAKSSPIDPPVKKSTDAALVEVQPQEKDESAIHRANLVQ